MYVYDECFCFRELSIGFLAVLRRHGDLSHRGPLIILVIWIALALLSCIWLRSSILEFQHQPAHDFTTDIILVCLHSLYFLTLLFKGSSSYVQRRAIDDVSCFTIQTNNSKIPPKFNLSPYSQSGASKFTWHTVFSIPR